MRTIEVPGLGYEAVIVTVDGERLLLIDARTDWPARMGLMAEAMDAST